MVKRRLMPVQPQPIPVSDRRTRFARDGYMIADGLFPSAAIASLRADFARVFSHQLRAQGLPVHDFATQAGWRANLVSLFGVNVEAYLAAARQCQLLPSLHALGVSQPLMKLLRELGLSEPVISTKPVCHFMTDDLRIPGGYHKSPPHQDWRSMQGSLDGCVVWVPLTVIDANSYPVEVVPGSHRLGLLDTVPHPATPMVNDPRIRDEDYIPVLVEPGDAVVFSGFLVHRTGEQGDARIRLALSLRYNNLAEPTYIAHGYPTPYRYSYQLELLFNDFPAAEQVQAVYPADD